ncbi:MAG: Coenzyme F420 hydrogenase/dehydrogenase, beta subunit C-terminal domain [Halanaerobiales bacterium]|nr:Coenzyme F420 hydrogenase/dehydrogenase, beta subunit C-terminal domain [Halanaerobiales bacterium]
MKIYACKNKDKDVVLKSSSGGIFTALAEQVIDEGGEVIGAAYNGLDVIHKVADNKEDLKELRKSKYVKSTIDYNIMSKDRLTLFSGTPCKMMFNRDNLILVDFICHGTPTKASFKRYCSENGIKQIDFRDKSRGWTNFEVNINGKKEDFQDNKFMQDFLNNRNLTKPCYNCQFKNFKSNSDIMLGDFWGVGNEYPEFADNKGISVVFLKTTKGEQLFNKIKEKVDYIEVELDKVVKYNPSLLKVAKR